MKMTKKWLLAAAVMMAASFGFMGCGNDDETDPYGIVNGSNNNYWVGDKDEGYTNEGTTTLRGFDTTTFNHAGGLVEVTFKDIATVETNSTYNSSAGVMGLIWNLTGAKGSTKVDLTAEDGITFYVVGARCSDNGEVQGYISKYSGIKELNKTNFGAPAVPYGQKTGAKGTVNDENTTIGAQETEIVSFTGSKKVEPTDGNVTVWIYVSPNKLESPTDSGKPYDGTFTVKVLSKLPTIENDEIVESSIEENSVLFSEKTTDTVEGGVSKSDIQKKLGIYANVYAGANLRGTWKFDDTFLNAGVIEDAE